MTRTLVGLVAVAASVLGTSHAALDIVAKQVGNDVVISHTGTIDLTGANFVATLPSSGEGIDPLRGQIVFGVTTFDLYDLSTAFGAFGNGGTTIGTSTGDAVGVTDVALAVATGYQSGSTIQGELTFLNATLASLGMAPGIYTATIPSDAITFTVDGAIPVPGALPLMAAGLGLLGFMRKKHAASPASS